MTKAFLFGGPYNGENFEFDNDCGGYINLPSPINTKYTSYDVREPLDPMELMSLEIYRKGEMLFGKDGWNSPNGTHGYKQLEDLNVYFHSSITNELIESVSQVILLSFNAQWKGVVHGY